MPGQHLARQEMLIGSAKRILGEKHEFIKPCPLAGAGVDQPPGFGEGLARGDLGAVGDGQVKRRSHASPVARGFGSGRGGFGRGPRDRRDHGRERGVGSRRQRFGRRAGLRGQGERRGLRDLEN